MRFERAAGVLLHPTSLPGRYGIGDLGRQAYDFVDFLVAANQRLWQILPLGPTGYADSPYQCFSAFAGNPLLISPDRLVEQGYLPAAAVAHVPPFPGDKVDFGRVIDYKQRVLQQAYAHFKEHATAAQKAAYTRFRKSAVFWLDDFALFMALKEHHKDTNGGVWSSWPAELAQRDPAALKRWSKTLAAAIDNHRFQQFLFAEQWAALKTYANERNIKIIGDVPIFVAYDSADTWSHPELFYLKPDGQPDLVAGVPPDYFSATGQRWGNPLYRWNVMREDNYAWWVERMRAVLTQTDIVRIDHFRGFAAYWEIPAEEPTAIIGRWVKGPGIPFFESLRAQLGDLPIIAEDLGVITPDVEALRDTFSFPGMKILQFAFGGEQNSDFLPYNFVPNSVVYTGTHDNETTLGWYRNASEQERDHVRRYLAVSGDNIVWDMMRLAYGSVSDMAVIPMQDLLVLDNEARMNYPGKTGGWWGWRYTERDVHLRLPAIAMGLRELTHLFGRPVVRRELTEEETAEMMKAARAVDA